MPTIFNDDGFRFFFYSKDLGERPHVHVESTDGEAKIWLDSFTIAKIFGDIGKKDLRKII
ncbi:MAG TPA: DUF4160 domain-containing protein, partial [Spirochaetia bacterium]|nr:DUF4160 domain-containing protein [Spirochaetia bacterium]